jgi:hypothetical protein
MPTFFVLLKNTLAIILLKLAEIPGVAQDSR